MGQSILDAWKTRRTRELQGLDAPYDVGKLELLKKEAEAGKARRARLRREKRKRQGIIVSPHESDADSVDETQTPFPHPPVNIATLRNARNSERQQQVQAARKSKVSPEIRLKQEPICMWCGISTTLTYQSLLAGFHVHDWLTDTVTEPPER